MNTGFVNGMLHALSYFRLNFRFIDFAEHIHLPGWMKYELFNKWLFVLEGEPELGDEGEFLIQFFGQNGYIYRELTLIIEKPEDLKNYKLIKKQKVNEYL